MTSGDPPNPCGCYRPINGTWIYPQTPPYFPETNPYPITPSYYPTMIDKPKNPWQCPSCKTWYAPHIDKCECEKK